MTRSEPAALAGGDDVVERLGHLAPAPRVASERNVHLGGSMAFMRMRSPSSAPPPLRRRGVDGEDGDPELVLLVEAEAPHELVGERRLARSRRCR